MEIQLLLPAVTPCPGWVQILRWNGPNAVFNHKPVTLQGLSPGSHPLMSALAPKSAQWDRFCSKSMNMLGFMLTSWSRVTNDYVIGKATNFWLFNSLRWSLQKKKIKKMELPIFVSSRCPVGWDKTVPLLPQPSSPGRNGLVVFSPSHTSEGSAENAVSWRADKSSWCQV